MVHLYEPLPALRPVAELLERLPVALFPAEVPPHEVALVTWTDRMHFQHRARNARYCARWGYACYLNATRRLPHLPQTFEKLPLVRWALQHHQVVLQLDDDASVHRAHQPLQDFLRTFPTASLIASSAGWDVPVALGEYKTTWDVDTTVHPTRPKARSRRRTRRRAASSCGAERVHAHAARRPARAQRAAGSYCTGAV